MFYNADSGLYLTQYRAYDPVTARWLSRDPIDSQFLQDGSDPTLGDGNWSSQDSSISIVSLSATANWLNQNCTPSQSQLNDFLSENGFNATVGFWGGVSGSYTPGSGTATGIGLVTPQAGASWNYSFNGGNFGFTW